MKSINNSRTAEQTEVNCSRSWAHLKLRRAVKSIDLESSVCHDHIYSTLCRRVLGSLGTYCNLRLRMLHGPHLHMQEATDLCWSVSAIDLILHPTCLAVAAPTLGSAGLVDVVGYEAALPVCAWHSLIIGTRRDVGRRESILCHDVCRHIAVQSSVRQFGYVTISVRSLYRARWSCCWHPWLQPVGTRVCFCLSPERQGIMQEVLWDMTLLSRFS